MEIIGIDPGRSGGMAILKGETVMVWSFKKLNIHGMRDLIRGVCIKDSICFMEKVWAFPGQGVTSCFHFGEHFGILKAAMVFSDIKTYLIPPLTWKRDLGIDAPAGTESREKKKISLEMAKKLFPKLQMNHAISEALLIAEYGRRFMNKRGIS